MATLTGRRTLVVVVALTVLAAGGTATAYWLDQRAERVAEIEAANAEVEQEIADRLRELEESTARAADVATSLRMTLEEHLTVSDRTDEQLQADRTTQQQLLRAFGHRLQDLADRPPPDVPEDADEDALADGLQRLSELQDRAGELGGRAVTAADGAEAWAAALTDLRAQAQRYVETVENQPETHDPDRLRRLWEEEKAVLAEYRAAAEAAQQIEGLGPLAQAYVDYIDANVRFADEVIALLEEGDIEAYNQRLKETFETSDDPFGFQAAIERATDESLDLGVVEELGTLRADANDLLADVRGALEAVAPTPVPTPSPTSG